jgi:hypothetical protein
MIFRHLMFEYFSLLFSFCSIEVNVFQKLKSIKV